MPLNERFNDADAAVIGVVRTITERHSGVPARVLLIDVEQRVKGELGDQEVGLGARQILVDTPLDTDRDVRLKRGVTTGLLLSSLPRRGWYATACSVVAPGPLVAEGGKPRGAVIKVLVGIVILALVLLWALLRFRKGTRPDLPGAPQS